MDSTGAMGILGFIGVILCFAGAFIRAETDHRKLGNILLTVGLLHIFPILCTLWLKVLL